MVEIISVHIDKTAGMLLCDILKQVYGQNLVHVIWKGQASYKFEDKLNEPVPLQTRVIHGAFPVSYYENRFIDAKRVVWVRNPVERLISYYFYLLAHRLPFPNGLKEMNILEFAAHHQICNQMSKMIGTLSSFFFVGIYEFLSDDLYCLQKLQGWPKIAISPINVNPFPNYDEEKKAMLGNKYLVSDIKSLNNLDIQLYQQALNVRESRLKTARLEEIKKELER